METLIEPDGLAPVPVDRPTGDKARVERVLLNFASQCVSNAKNAYSTIMRRCADADQFVRANRLGLNSSIKAQDLEQSIRIPESVNQANQVKAIFYESAFQNNDLWRAAPVGGEQYARTDATKKVVDATLRETGMFSQLQLALSRYVDYPFAGLKGVPRAKTVTRYERRTPMSPEEAQALISQGGEPAGEAGDILVPSTYQKVTFNIEAIDPRRFYQSDNFRPTKESHSCHECHILSESEILRNPAWKNLDRLGTSNTSGRNTPSEYPQNGQDTSTNELFPLFELWESWFEVPWTKWLSSGQFNEYDLDAFCLFYDIVPSELDLDQKWQVIHKGSETLFKVAPNYLLDKTQYPYTSASYIQIDGQNVGFSFLEGVADLQCLLEGLYNLWFDNARLQTYQPMLFSQSSDLTVEKMKELWKPKGMATIPGNLSPEEALKFLQIPDLSKSIMPLMEQVVAMMRTYGVPDIMQGVAASDTATQDQMAMRLGSTKTNSPFRRFIMDVLVPQLYNAINFVYKNYDGDMMIDAIGEEGAALAGRQYISSCDVTNRVKVEPLASFDLANASLRVQQTIAIANVFGAMLSPEQVQVLLTWLCEYQGMPQDRIEELSGSSGLGTDVQQEIATMLRDPNAVVKVNRADPHNEALMAAQQAVMEHPELGMNQNFLKYVNAHVLMLQEQMMQAQMGGNPFQSGATAQGGKRGAQPVNGPQTEEGTARQSGQQGSPPDQGVETASGQTGTGSPQF